MSTKCYERISDCRIRFIFHSANTLYGSIFSFPVMCWYGCHGFWSYFIYVVAIAPDFYHILTKSRHNLNQNSINSHFVFHFSPLHGYCRIKPLSTSLLVCFVGKKFASIFSLVHTMNSEQHTIRARILDFECMRE